MAVRTIRVWAAGTISVIPSSKDYLGHRTAPTFGLDRPTRRATCEDRSEESARSDLPMGVGNIGDKHVAGCMGDGERWFRCHNRCLGSDAASPEHGHFTLTNFNRIAKIGARQIGNAQELRLTNMWGRAMYSRPTARNYRCSAIRLAGMGRIETPICPCKRPAGRQAWLVRYIGTLQPCVM